MNVFTTKREKEMEDYGQKQIDKLSLELYSELKINYDKSTIINSDLNSIINLHNEQFSNLYKDFAKIEEMRGKII